MNKYLKKGVILSIASMTILTGCGAKTIPTLDNGEQAIVTFKDDVKISINDLYNSLKDSYGLETVLNIIDRTILEKKYSGELEAAKENASKTMEQLKTAYGDELLSAIQYYTNYKTIEAYEDSLYLNYLQTKAVEDYAKSQIKESEIKKYYKDKIKSDIKVSHILFAVNYAEDASEEDKTKAKEEAKAKAQQVLDQLNSVSKNEISNKFSELAKENSEDESTKEDGGNLGFINVDTLGSTYQKLVDAAYALKDGAYSKDIVETELGYHLVMRTETKEKASLDEVRDAVIDALVSEYQKNNADCYIKAMQNVRKEFDMNIVDDDLSSKYTTYIQNALLQAQQDANGQNQQ